MVRQHAEFVAACGSQERGFESYAARLLASLDKIERRLGGALHQQLRQSMANAPSDRKSTAM